MSTKSISVQSTSSRTATQRLAHFCRCGNKEIREHLLRSLFKHRAKKQKSSRTPLSKSPQSHSNIVGQHVVATTSKLAAAKPTVVTTSKLFRSVFFSATPFVALKTRRLRRGKRVLAKVVTYDRQRGERKSLIALSSCLRSEGAVSKAFSERLERELEMISTTEGVLAIREKRDELHRLAFQSRPYRWGRKKNNFNNSNSRNTPNNFISRNRKKLNIKKVIKDFKEKQAV